MTRLGAARRGRSQTPSSEYEILAAERRNENPKFPVSRTRDMGKDKLPLGEGWGEGKIR